MPDLTDWSYTADPSGKPLDWVRLHIGDTECNQALLVDAEIDFFLAEEPDLYLAAARAAEAIAARFARDVQTSAAGLANASQQKFEHYMELASHLRRRSMSIPVSTGSSKDALLQDALDADLVQPVIFLGVHDNLKLGVGGE